MMFLDQQQTLLGAFQPNGTFPRNIDARRAIVSDALYEAAAIHRRRILETWDALVAFYEEHASTASTHSTIEKKPESRG